MPARIDLTGERFGRLVVLQYVGRNQRGPVWRCVCDCGNLIDVRSRILLHGSRLSCGCLRAELIIQLNWRHGLSKHPLYATWKGIIQRCTNPNNGNYAGYGGRGITICERWRGSFEAFVEDMGEKPFPKAEVDRVDNDGNYEPGNCAWATRTEQVRNRRVKSGNALSALYVWCNDILDDLPPSKRSARRAELEALISKKK